MNVSIIICTRNRADSLAQTLESFKAVEVPVGLQPELLVVDNGSTDHTAEVVRRHSAAKIPARYFLESSLGQSRARNTGMGACRGDVILFTDDDVVPQPNWLEHMVAPLVREECHGVVGRIELAKELCRAWMTPLHKIYLAVYEGPGPDSPQLIGACMGFHRSVLDRVPAFDVELGPGASGYHDECLFSWQLAAAGFRIDYAPEARVTHHPDPNRLLRSSWLATSRSKGVSAAYVMHHWFHEEPAAPRLLYCYVALKRHLRRLLEPPGALDAGRDGCLGNELRWKNAGMPAIYHRTPAAQKLYQARPAQARPVSQEANLPAFRRSGLGPCHSAHGLAADLALLASSARGPFCFAGVAASCTFIPFWRRPTPALHLAHFRGLVANFHHQTNRRCLPLRPFSKSPDSSPGWQLHQQKCIGRLFWRLHG